MRFALLRRCHILVYILPGVWKQVWGLSDCLNVWFWISSIRPSSAVSERFFFINTDTSTHCIPVPSSALSNHIK
ncbi:hypothetical protein QBC37DRAFT_155636 [Rhypophila decipiens]|uniref:Secreted protein n=1 Tax=Rhypophila decipiens TaxID=261697 RepID=A0AAN7B2L2_9PEZI|nr:hypothetical protein QBC37DRAFT_155636 [Rhypophila decipiens]